MARTISIRLSVEDAAAFKTALESASQSVEGFSDRFRTSLQSLSSQDATAKAGRDLIALAAAVSKAQSQLAAVPAGETGAYAAALANVTIRIESYGRALDGIGGKLDPQIALQNRYKATLELTEQAERLGALTAEQAAASRARATAGLEAGTEQLTGHRAALAAVAAAEQAHAASITTSFGALDALRASYAPLVAAEQAHATAIREIASLESSGRLTTDEATAARKRADTALEASTERVTGHKQALAADAAAQQAHAASVTSSIGALENLRNSYAPLAAAEQARSEAIRTANALQASGNITEVEADSVRIRAQASYNAVAAVITKRTAAEQALMASMRATAAAEQAGTITAAEADGQRAKAQKSYASVSQAIDEAAGHQHGFNLATAGATRELLVLGHEAVTGNYSRIPGSLIVMAERAGGLQDVLKGVGAALTSVGGLFGIAAAAGVLAFGVLVYRGEQELTRMGDLRSALRATSTDYVALADQVERVSKAVAKSAHISKDDAFDVTGILASTKYFSGTAEQLERLAGDAVNIGRVFSSATDDTAKLADGAKLLSKALSDPLAVAQDLASRGFPQMSAEVLKSVESFVRMGDKASATSTVIGALRAGTAGAAKDISPLNKALNELSEALSGKGGLEGSAKSTAVILAELSGAVVHDIAQFVGEVRTLFEQAKSIKDWLDRNAPSFSRRVVDADTGLPSNSSAELARQSPEIESKIYAIAEKNGFSPQIADLGTRIAFQESKGQQIDPRTGQTLTSSAGALGIGQLMPSTAAQYGVDPHNADQNILGMLRYLTDLSKNPQFKTEADVAGAYNAGPGRYGAFLAGQGAPLKPETVDYVRRVTGQTITASPGQAAVAPLRGDASTANLTNAQQSAADDLPGLITSTRASDAKKYAEQLVAVNAQMERLRATGQAGAAEYAGLVQVQGELIAKSAALISPQEAFLKNQRDQLEAGKALTGDAASLAAEIKKVEEASGILFTDDQKAQAYANQLRGLNVAFSDQLTTVNTATVAQTNLADAYGESYAKVAQVTIAQKAHYDAIKLFPDSLERQVEAEKSLTYAYTQQAQEAERLKLAQKTADSQDQLDYLAKETELVGTSTDARTKELAVFKARQELEKSGVAISEQAKQAYLDSIGAIEDGKSRLALMQNSMKDLEQIGTQAFDRIGNSITTAFANGSLKALDFGGVVKSVISEIGQQLLKAAIINPLLNELFGGTHRSTLSDLGGAVGSLLGNSGGGLDVGNADNNLSLVAAAINSGGSLDNLVGRTAGDGLVINSGGNGVAPGDLTAAEQALASNNSGSGGGLSLFQGVSSLATLAKGLDFISGGAVSEAVGSGGALSASSLAGGVTSTFGNASTATNIALSSAGEGVSGVATAGEVATASVGNAIGLSDAASATLDNAVGTVAKALPYIGIAVTVISDLAQGNYRGAGLVAGGAVLGGTIGSIFPIIGTAIGAAIGAAVGALADAFLPNHPMNQYQDTQVDIVGGHITAGRQVSQLETTDLAAGSVTQFSQQLDAFDAKVGIVIANADGDLGHVGQKIKGLEQFDSVAKLFPRLTFANDNADTSNFGVAKGALQGMHFPDIAALVVELGKIAAFSDANTALGIKLLSVGQDLTSIKIASVEQGDGSNKFRTALAHDLPGQTFATVDALSAEIDKVNQFVNGTIPGLLNPVIKVTNSAMVDMTEKTSAMYDGAISQARKYGLATDDLTAAQQKAIDLIRAPGVTALTAARNSLNTREYYGADAGAGGAWMRTMTGFDAGMQGQRDTLKKLYTDTYGDVTLTSADYLRDMATLERTLGAERVAIQRSADQQYLASFQAARATVSSVQARRYTLDGNLSGAELINYDAKVGQEREQYKQTLIGFYGEAYTQTEQYQKEITLLEGVQQDERLAIIKKYGDQATGALGQTAAQIAQATQTAQTNVGSVITSLAGYAQKLQQGATSPLSAQSQYDLARGQFNAVSGAAGAGDYNSASKLQTYADSFLTASRSVNGSGAGYAQDFNKVLDSLTAVGNVSPDTLTNSAYQQATQTQTVTLSGKFDELRAELVAVRRELMQMQRAA